MIDNYFFFTRIILIGFIQGINKKLNPPLREKNCKCSLHTDFQILTVHVVLLLMIKGFARARNPPGPASYVSLFWLLLEVKYGNPLLGADLTEAPNGLSKNLNLVSQSNGATLVQFSVRFTSSQQAGGPPLSHSPHCSPRGLRNS